MKVEGSRVTGLELKGRINKVNAFNFQYISM